MPELKAKDEGTAREGTARCACGEILYTDGTCPACDWRGRS